MHFVQSVFNDRTGLQTEPDFSTPLFFFTILLCGSMKTPVYLWHSEMWACFSRADLNDICVRDWSRPR